MLATRSMCRVRDYNTEHLTSEKHKQAKLRSEVHSSGLPHDDNKEIREL